MALRKSELYSPLWASGDELRGGMDASQYTGIAALEIKLTKARQLKQGMMQELLTGRIRLV